MWPRAGICISLRSECNIPKESFTALLYFQGKYNVWSKAVALKSGNILQ